MSKYEQLKTLHIKQAFDRAKARAGVLEEWLYIYAWDGELPSGFLTERDLLMKMLVEIQELTADLMRVDDPDFYWVI